jgi:hypothetical protein
MQLVEFHQRFGETYCLHNHGTRVRQASGQQEGGWANSSTVQMEKNMNV